MTNHTNTKTPTRPADAARRAQTARRNALKAIEKQAREDSKVGMAWLREKVDRYRLLDPASDEAIDIACGFASELCLWNDEAYIDTPTCRLGLSYFDVYDVSEIDLDQLRCGGAVVAYPDHVIVMFDEIEEELEELLIEVQKIGQEAGL